jgi:hypothetical protein
LFHKNYESIVSAEGAHEQQLNQFVTWQDKLAYTMTYIEDEDTREEVI